ncbi:MAG TPA: prolyl oligopeptidase family serine peptidase [Actinomycetota bacterium]|nr:prolyl oligopeptidase family serine peptidase [Actinomycetota bacterium]
MRFTHALAQVTARHTFAFTPDGTHVARITNRDGDLAVEAGAVGCGSPPERLYGRDPLLSVEAQVHYPAADRVWIRCGGPGGFRIVRALRASEGEGWTAASLEDDEAASLWLLPGSHGASRRDACDLVISSTEEGQSTIWRADDGSLRLHPVAGFPGFVTGGTWLEPPGLLAVNIHRPGHPSSGFVVDLVAQSYRRVFHVSEHSNDTIARVDAEPGRLWVATDFGGHRKAGVADLRGGRARFFGELPGEERSVDPVGRHGRRLVLRRQAGVSTELWLGDPADLSVSGPLPLPSGFVSSPVVDAGDRLRFAFSSPTVPPSCAACLPSRDAFQLEEGADLGPVAPGRLVTPRILAVHGPHGAIETLVYEPPPDRRRNLIVVALHGGPVAQWSAAFTPELQLFTGLGAEVAAPNYHGSIGYGVEFVRTLEHAAGSVDVDDVIAVVDAMRAEPGLSRAPVVLFGHSYGAFLSLLVAAAHPRLCEGVIALAPFSSLAAVRVEAKPPVRRIADLLRNPHDEGRDLLRRCGDLRAKVLIVHGSHDMVVPILESHALCRALRANGYLDGRDLWFLPLPDGHVITARPAVMRLYDQIESFLSQPFERRRPGEAAVIADSLGKEQEVAGRRPHPRARESRVLCDAIPKGGERT